MPDLLRDRLQSSLGSAYTLERELGGGGMSRVFVAKDEALGRDVVVKVLAPELAEGLSAERFAREIRVAAALQEPHIVPVLSAGVTVDGLPYYTMPFVRGESLRARLAAGALPLPDSVVVLRDVATALEYAHGQGLVHRDIKPENVLLSGRTAVVTDFGIAKALAVSKTQAPDGPAGGTLTQVGTSLGTPAYMAPEQAVGDAVDVRADLYAWGVVAYELLAGRHPFAGRTTAQQLVAAHLTEVPAPLATVRPELPGDLAALVARCLAKSSNERPASAQELLAVLEALGDATGRRATAARGHPLVAGALALTVLAGLGLAAASPQLLRRVPTPYTLGATTQVTASPELELDAALSPDGRLLAYVAPRDGVYRVVVRQLAGGRTVVVADTGGPQRAPRWSPDGTQLLYGSEGAVFAVPALGGSPRALVRAGTGFFLQSNPTPAWSPDGRRFAYADTSGILVRALDGGEARRVAAGTELHSPAWSPDGGRLAYVAGNRNYVTISGNTSPSAIWTVPSDGGPARRVTEAQHLNASPVWTPDGRSLLYVSNAGGMRDVYHVPLDAAGAPAGAPARLTTGLEPYAISLAADGRLLAYSSLRLRSNVWSAPVRPDGVVPRDSLRQVTRENQRVEGLDPSPDGRALVFDANRFGNGDVFRVALDGGEPVRLTDDPADDFQPVWSPDGRQIAFYSTRAGSKDVYVMDADGRNVERVTSLPGQERFPTWSPDGRRLAFDADADGSLEVYVAERRPGGGWTAPVRLTRGGAGWPRWSPDGQWISALHAGAVLLIPGRDAPVGGVVPPRVLVPAPRQGPGALFTAWSADPTRVVYAAIDVQPLAWRFYSVPVSGGAPRLELRFDPREHVIGGVTFAARGDRLLFTLSADDADVWTMELRRP